MMCHIGDLTCIFTYLVPSWHVSEMTMFNLATSASYLTGLRYTKGEEY